MSKEWFILQFKPNSHNQAAKNLNRQGFETFGTDQRIWILMDLMGRKTKIQAPTEDLQLSN